MSYFTEDEFYCKCTTCKGRTGPGVFPELVKKLNAAREIAGIPFSITSGYRCMNHPEYRESSSHGGLAVDISTNHSRNRYIILDALIRTKFNRIGIGKDFIHVDIDIDKPKEVIWVY